MLLLSAPVEGGSGRLAVYGGKSFRRFVVNRKRFT
jgi:hypothetical protein